MSIAILTRSPLFKGLTENEIEGLLKKSGYRIRLFPAGTMIVQSGDTIMSLLIVLSGHVRGEMTDISGRVIKIEDILPPQALAVAFMFGAGGQYPVNVCANIDSEILTIDRREFLSLLMFNEKMLVNFLDVISSRALFLSERLRFLSFHTIRGKLAHYLMSLPGASTGSVIIDRSQQDLADYFGVTRPSVARALREMEDDGLIDVSRRNVIIKSGKGLSEILK